MCHLTIRLSGTEFYVDLGDGIVSRGKSGIRQLTASIFVRGVLTVGMTVTYQLARDTLSVITHKVIESAQLLCGINC